MRAINIKNIAVIMSVIDNIAIAKTNIKKDTVTEHAGKKIKILDLITKGNRFSTSNIKYGKPVIQYGYQFAISKGLKEGRLIAEKNTRNQQIDYKKIVNKIFKNGKNKVLKINGNRTAENKTFLGYVRADGRVGTRNYYLIVPSSMCAGDVANKIASELDNDRSLKRKYKNIDGIVSASHTEGCGCNDGAIIERLLLTLKNTIIHPNVCGTLVVDLGCEKTNYDCVSKYFGNLKKYGKPIDFVSIQELGGTKKAVEKGIRIVKNRLGTSNKIKRKKVPVKYLTIGTECGASDSFSGITANPLIGSVVDKIVYSGGSAILSETPEMIGAEISLLERMISKAVALKFISGINYYKNLASKLGVSMDGNLVDANKKGGLLNVAIKSLGAVLKGGSSKIVDFLDYSELATKQGLNIMNGPGNDLESVTGVVASGANLILFSTGSGATEGSIITPTIRISSTTELYEKMKDDIDFDAGRVLDKTGSLDKLSSELLDMVTAAASGKKTKSEILEKRSFQIWTAGKLSL